VILNPKLFQEGFEHYNNFNLSSSLPFFKNKEAYLTHASQYQKHCRTKKNICLVVLFPRMKSYSEEKSKNIPSDYNQNSFRRRKSTIGAPSVACRR
jgi:hypothetical protein